MIDIIAMLFIIIGRYALIKSKSNLMDNCYLIGDILFVIYGSFIFSVGLILCSGINMILDLKILTKKIKVKIKNGK